MNVLRYCFILGAVVITFGMQIEFSASPKVGTGFSLIEQLVLRCSLNDTQSSKKVKSVTSIKVTKNGESVPLTHRNDLEVNGKVSKVTPKDSYLELVRTFPKQTEAGSYTCEINAVDEFSEKFVLTKTLQVDSLPDILTQVQSNLKSMHIETGYGVCGHIRSSMPLKKVTVKFSQAYDVVPKVAVSLSKYDTDRNYADRFSIRVIKTKATDFTVECYTWGDTIIYNSTFFWISFI